jgi:hypothetical protein
LLRLNELQQATASAGLAVSDGLWKSAQAVESSIMRARQNILAEGSHYSSYETLDREIADFTKAAKKELGIVHIDA